MRLKKGTDIIKFMNEIKICKGDVLFETTQDRIDLKSVLSQYVFFTIIENDQLMRDGALHCEYEEDFQRLNAYLE